MASFLQRLLAEISVREGKMQALLGMAVALALAWGAPAAAVIIASGNGTGNTSAPPDDPGWDNVVNLSGLTGVYLGNGWVLTANHVGARDMIIGSDVYEPVPDSKERLETAGSNADLALFQIVRDPWLPDVVIRSSSPLTFPPAHASEVVMIGRGRNRGAFTDQYCGTDGWLWGAGSTMRWGTNKVYQIGIDLSISGTLTRAFSTLFDAGLPTPDEAQVATGDSGGAVFVKNEETSEWELAGIMTARSSFGTCQPSASALYGNHTYAADLSFYLDQINEIADVPACNDGVDQDGDGLVDYPDDPGCDDSLDPFETSDVLPCDDGIDNDGDGGVDFDPETYADPGNQGTPPAGVGDPGCGSPNWTTESPQCQDGIHNDSDGQMDYDAGLSASGTADPAGPDQQCLGKPWKNQEQAVSSCGLGSELAFLLPLLIWIRRRRR